jgi:hypothetical protein
MPNFDAKKYIRALNKRISHLTSSPIGTLSNTGSWTLGPTIGQTQPAQTLGSYPQTWSTTTTYLAQQRIQNQSSITTSEEYKKAFEELKNALLSAKVGSK